MSFKSNNKYQSNLEKCYYNTIYKRSSDFNPKNNNYLSSNLSISGNHTPRSSFNYYTKSLQSSNNTYESSPRSHRSRVAYSNADQAETESIIYNMRRLGVESPSFSSVMNLRNLSYLQSREHDCIETLLVHMEPAIEAEEKQAEEEQLAPTAELIVEEQPPKESRFKRVRVRCRQGLTLFSTKLISLIRKLSFLIDPIDFQSKMYLFWLSVVSLAYIYNLIGISLRYSFGYDTSPETYANIIELQKSMNMTSGNGTSNSTSFSIIEMVRSRILVKVIIAWYLRYRFMLWTIFDISADVVYLIDIFLVQGRIKYIREGLWIVDKKLMFINYTKMTKFKFDIFSILPFDLIQLIIGPFPLLRINRFFKIKSLWEFFDRWDRSVQSYVFIVRLIRLFTYLLIVIHLYACSYYKLSYWETQYMNITNDWVYSHNHRNINSYTYSFLFGLKTASTIGNNPKPFTKYEYLFTAIAYVVALFLFALIVGQIRNIIGSQTTKQDAFLIVLDSTIRYVKSLNLPDYLMEKVVMWFDFYANEQNAIPFQAITFLPINVQTDLAIEVYFELLSKVKLFQECEKNLLYSLVLKLRPVIYMPGDYICKKGDVGREMFIIEKGIVEVVVNNKAVAKMEEGKSFGEIALLSMGDGGNRRTASIVSKGFSRLLVLQKSDLDEILLDYPEMRDVLSRTADTYLKKK